MPVSLPQLSRRQFLKRAALAGTAAAFGPHLAQAGLFGKPRDAGTFALYSDTHINANAKTQAGGINMADNFAAGISELAQWRVRPAGVIVNGDLAHNHGTPGDYATFGGLAHPLRALAPVHLSLGNHDQRDNFWKAFPKDATRIDSVPHKQASIIISKFADWFLLDSLDVTAQTAGELGSAQLDWLDHQLAARREKPVIIVCHHPLDITGFLGLKDSLLFEELLAPSPPSQGVRVWPHSRLEDHATRQRRAFDQFAPDGLSVSCRMPQRLGAHDAGAGWHGGRIARSSRKNTPTTANPKPGLA